MSGITEERFLSRLSEFASGRVGVGEFLDWLGEVLATDDFDVSLDPDGRTSAKLSYASHCASHLDLATDPRDPRHDDEKRGPWSELESISRPTCHDLHTRRSYLVDLGQTG